MEILTTTIQPTVEKWTTYLTRMALIRMAQMQLYVASMTHMQNLYYSKCSN